MKFKFNKKRINTIAPIIVAAVILAIIGYIVWSNSSKTVDTTVTTTEEVNLGTKVEFNSAFINKVAFSYPKGWTDSPSGFVAKTAKNPSYETHILTSPSGNVKIIINVGEDSGVRGNCVVSSMPTPSAKNTLVNTYENKTLPNSSYIELVGEENGKVAYTYFGLVTAAKASKTKLDGNVCDVKPDSLIVNLPLKTDNSSTGYSILDASIRIVNLSIKKDATKTDYETAFTQAEYKDAKSILMSIQATKP